MPAAATHGNLLGSLLHRANPALAFEEWKSMPNPGLYQVAFLGGEPIGFEMPA